MFRSVSCGGKSRGGLWRLRRRDKWGWPVVGSADYITLGRPLSSTKRAAAARRCRKIPMDDDGKAILYHLETKMTKKERNYKDKHEIINDGKGGIKCQPPSDDVPDSGGMRGSSGAFSGGGEAEAALCPLSHAEAKPANVNVGEADSAARRGSARSRRQDPPRLFRPIRHRQRLHSSSARVPAYHDHD